MQGLHLTADLHGCAVERPAMTEPARCAASACSGRGAGLRAVGELFHRFAPLPPQGDGPVGITGVVLLAESHLAVHTWPELGAVTLDVYVCNIGADNSARAACAARRADRGVRAGAGRAPFAAARPAALDRHVASI